MVVRGPAAMVLIGRQGPAEGHAATGPGIQDADRTGNVFRSLDRPRAADFSWAGRADASPGFVAVRAPDLSRASNLHRDSGRPFRGRQEW